MTSVAKWTLLAEEYELNKYDITSFCSLFSVVSGGAELLFGVENTHNMRLKDAGGDSPQ